MRISFGERHSFVEVVNSQPAQTKLMLLESSCSVSPTVRRRSRRSGCVLIEQEQGNENILDEGESAEEDLDTTIRMIALKVYGALPKPSAVDLADLIQAGNVGLLQARRSYNPNLGVPLAAFARFRIRGEMLDAVHHASPLGNHVRGEKVHGAVRTISVENWREESPRIKHDWVPESQACRSQHRRLLNKEMRRMPSTDRAVLELKYAEDFTLRQIGSMMQVKESRACQIHRRALARLRRALERVGVDGMART